MTKRKSALITGISLILMTIAAIYTLEIAQAQLFAETIQETIKNIQETSFLTEALIGWSIIIVLDLIVSIAIFYFIKPFDVQVAKWSAGLRLLYTCILIVAVSFLFRISLTPEKAFEYKDVFESTWEIGLIIFGLHLFATGFAFYKFKISKLMGILLMLAGLSYVLVHSLYQFPSIDSVTAQIETVLIAPMMIGELGMALWLIIKFSRRVSNTSVPNAS